VESNPGLQGRRALVTGGSAGIGRAIATGLVQQGARVAVVARTREPLLECAGAIGALPLVADLATPAAAAELAARALELFGGLDILVLSSGIHVQGSIAELADSALSELLGANLIGPAALAKHLASALCLARGHVVVVNSTVVRAQNIRGRAYYAAGQHAMKAFTDGLRDELNEHGVSVTSIFPGVTATPRQERLHQAAGKDYQPEALLQATDVAAAAMAALRMRDTAEMTDIYIRPKRKT
jgi:NAD(P)-dependent dehydrogenase (short-subunit alcohol dehydrogenase family)